MMTDAALPPYCEVHGCRGRWDADQPHTLCGKTTTAADRSWLYEHPEPGMRPAAIAADEARYESRRAAAEDPPPLDDRPTRAELAAEELDDREDDEWTTS